MFEVKDHSVLNQQAPQDPAFFALPEDVRRLHKNIQNFLPHILDFYSKTGADHALHTAEFREDASGDYAFENTMRASAVTAAAAFRFLEDENFRKKVRADWKRQTTF